VASCSKDSAEVVTVGAHIEAFGAVDAKANCGESDIQDLILVDANATGRAIDGFAFAGEFVEGNPIFFDCRDHGRDLIKLACKFFKCGLKRGGLDRGNGLGFENFSCRVLCIGCFTQFESALVHFVLGHEKVLDAGGFADNEHEEPGGDGIEGAAVAYLALLKASTDKVDNIMGGFAGGLVDEQ